MTSATAPIRSSWESYVPESERASPRVSITNSTMDGAPEPFVDATWSQLSGFIGTELPQMYASFGPSVALHFPSGIDQFFGKSRRFDAALVLMFYLIDARSPKVAAEAWLRCLLSLVGWPEQGEQLARKILEDVAQWRIQVSALPTLPAWKGAARILRLALSRGMNPTDAAPLQEGGIGLAWSNFKVAVEAEATNLGDLAFSHRVRGQSAELHLITNDAESITSELDEAAALHRKAVGRD